MTSHKKIKVAIVGFGLSGEIFHAPFIVTSANFELVAVVCSRRERVIAQFPWVQVFATVTEMLAGITVDLVVIASPNQTHYDIAKICLEHSKHVVIEKPWVLTSAHAQELILLAQQTNRIVCAYQNRRWDGPAMMLNQLLTEQVFGEIYQCEFHFDRYRPIAHQIKWKEMNVSGAGSLYDLGPHLIDHALRFFGRPDSIQADLAVQRKTAGVTDYFHILLTYGTMRVLLHSSSVMLSATPHIQVHGEKASYVCYNLDPQEKNLLAQKNYPQSSIARIQCQQDVIWNIEDGKINQTPLQIPAGDYQNYYEQLHQAILGHAEQPISQSDMLDNVRLIELAIESHNSARKIKFTSLSY